jgi:hypothetical protein
MYVLAWSGGRVPTPNANGQKPKHPFVFLSLVELLTPSPDTLLMVVWIQESLHPSEVASRARHTR